MADGWQVAIVPTFAALWTIHFADEFDTLDGPATAAEQLSIWATERWNASTSAIPALPTTPSLHPLLDERRALSIAALLKASGVATHTTDGRLVKYIVPFYKSD